MDHYQNAFGAKVDGVAPSTFVYIKEVTVDKKIMRSMAGVTANRNMLQGLFL